MYINYQMKKTFRVASKYLVERVNMFSRQQLVLSIKEEGVQLHPLCKEKESKEGGIQRLLWEQISTVQVNERDSASFSISHGRKGGNLSQMQFQCKERNRLITELAHYLHSVKGGEPLFTDIAKHQSDIYKPDSLRAVSVQVFPTILEVRISAGGQPRPGKQEQANESAVGGARDSMSMRKRPLPQDLEEESKGLWESAARSGFDQELQTLEAMEQDYEPEDTGAALLTPYRGSMFGGTYVGEDHSKNMGVKKRSQTHYIYFSQISKVCALTDSLMIIKKNQEIERFTFRDADRVKACVQAMDQGFRENFRKSLQYFNVPAFEQDKIYEEIDFLQKPSQPVFIQNVQSCTWNGLVGDLQLQVDENAVYEVEAAQQRVRKRGFLADLLTVRIIDSSHSEFNLVLIFQQDTEFVLKIPTNQERERLLAVILYLRSFVMQDLQRTASQNKLDFLQVHLNSSVDFTQRIHGLEPYLSISQTEYEIFLLKSLSESLAQSDEQKVSNLIEEAVLNAGFAGVIKLEPRYVRDVLKEIETLLEQYLSLEASEPQAVANVLSEQQNGMDFLTIFDEQTRQVQRVTKEKRDQDPRANNLLSHPLDETKGAEMVNNVDQIVDKASKYLNLLRLLLNSKVFLAEMLEHADLLESLVKLLGSKSGYLALLSTLALKSALNHHSGSEAKLEAGIKRLLVRGGPETSKPQIQVPKLEQQGNQCQQFLLFPTIFMIIQRISQLQKKRDFIYSLHVSNLCQVLRAFFKPLTAKAGLEGAQQNLACTKEEWQALAASIWETGSKSSKWLLHVLEKENFQKKHFEIEYLNSLLIDLTLGYYKKYDNEQLKVIQAYLLTYSTQFLQQILHRVSSQVSQMKYISVQVLSKLLFQSADSMSLLTRIFPRTLIEKVTTSIDVLATYSWGDEEWQDFFDIVSTRTFDSATEQWGEATREELKRKIGKEINDFARAQLQQEDGIGGDQLLLPSHEYNNNGKVFSRCQNLKWNSLEFKVEYDCLKDKYKVWKYFLRKLLREENLNERERPNFTVDIREPTVFWHELKIRFMSTLDEDEQITILKTMIVLYNKHSKNLKELKSLPYWLRLMEQPSLQHCHFVLLQLMHVALSVPDQESKERNMKKFIKAGGLEVIFSLMKLSFSALDSSQKNMMPDQLQPNYTNSFTCSKYFKRNCLEVSIAILSLKVLDLIFKDMSSRDQVPLPSNRQHLMQRSSLATLTQMLMLEEVDLTREITIFIQTHMDNHYSYFQLKESAMIQYLVLTLSTRNGVRALELLQKFQEVCIEFNQNLKIGLFNSNDLKMVQDDRTENNPIFQSIYLRFLPVPFIKYLYEEGPQAFLKAYRSSSFESPILIWNDQLRNDLESAIRSHSAEFIEQLKVFSHLDPSDKQSPDNFPVFEEKFKQIVTFPSIESEVRCGRYYLRVWVQQKKDSAKFFKIPLKEEEEFYKNLQAELRQAIHEERLKDHKKVLVLFRSCLLALQTFKKKRILSLDEVKRVLLKVSQRKQYRSDIEKQLLHIGIKIIYEAIMNNDDNLKEMQTINGVEIINLVLRKLLKHSFKNAEGFLSNLGASQTTKTLGSLGQNMHADLSTSFTRNNPMLVQEIAAEEEDEEEEKDDPLDQKQDSVDFDRDLDSSRKESAATDHPALLIEAKSPIKVDRVEAKTLSLCVKTFTILLNDDIQSFVDVPLYNKIGLFKQIACVLDLSYSLLQDFKPRKLALHHEIQETNQSGSYAHGAHQSSGGAGHNLRSKSGKRGVSKSRHEAKKQSKSRGKSIGAQRGVRDITEVGVLHQRERAKTRKQKKKKKIEKSAQIDYSRNSLLDIAHSKQDKYAIGLILEICRSVTKLTKEITKHPVLHPELIASGMAWKTIQHFYFALTEECLIVEDLEYILRYATVTLKNLTSFATAWTEKGGDAFAFKNLNREQEREILSHFAHAIKQLFGKKILSTLQCEFEITNNMLDFKPYKQFEPSHFLGLFSVQEVKSAELVWNDETRKELQEVIIRQVSLMSTMIALSPQSQMSVNDFFTELERFDYTINKTELRVQDIFVRHFNHDPESRPQDLNLVAFCGSLDQKLKRILNGRRLHCLPEEQVESCLEIVKAFRNLVANARLMEEGGFRFDEMVASFSTMIVVDLQDSGELKQAQEKVRPTAQVIVDIVKSVAKHEEMARKLVSNMAFIRLIIRTIKDQQVNVITADQIIQVLSILLDFSDCMDLSEFFIRSGMIFFILEYIFNKKMTKKNRVEFIKLIIGIHGMAAFIYTKFIPPPFLFEIQKSLLQNQDGVESQLLLEFVANFDANEFENVFIIWNADLRKESHSRIKANCELFWEKIEHCEDLLSVTEEGIDIEEMENPLMKNEIIVDKVILRIFNKNPAVFIDRDLNSFIEDVCQLLQGVSQMLIMDLQVIEENSLQIDPQKRTIIDPKGVFDEEKREEFQKGFNYRQYQALLMLTALMLAIEQLLSNPFNPNHLFMTSAGDKQQSQKAIWKSYMSSHLSQSILADKVHSVVSFWLSTQVFLDKHLPLEIRISFLQLMILVVKTKESVSRLQKNNDSLLDFIQDAVKKIGNPEEQSYRTLEEALIFMLIINVVEQGLEFVTMIAGQCDTYLAIHEKKKKLKKLIECIMAQVCKNNQYQSSIIHSIKKRQALEVSVTMDPKVAQDGKYGNDLFQAFQLWRTKAVQPAEGVKRFMFAECTALEDNLTQGGGDDLLTSNIAKLKLPILSRKSTAPIDPKDVAMQPAPAQLMNLGPSVPDLAQHHPFATDAFPPLDVEQRTQLQEQEEVSRGEEADDHWLEEGIEAYEPDEGQKRLDYDGEDGFDQEL